MRRHIQNMVSVSKSHGDSSSAITETYMVEIRLSLQTVDLDKKKTSKMKKLSGCEKRKSMSHIF